MSEVLPCPVCGNIEVEHEQEGGDCCVEYYMEYECYNCGDDTPTFRTKHSWNQYAAAMEYTKVMVRLEKAMKLASHGYFKIDHKKAGDMSLTEAKELALKIFTEEG